MSTGNTYPVVGIEGSGIQPRLEIRDLQQHPIQFSLFIQAFNIINEMRDKNPQSPNYYKKPNSWWEIGAIHGLPFEAWTGDPNGPQTSDPKSAYGGYCYHASTLFPTWHRVLLLLVEQALVKEAVSIATRTGKEEWLQAARTLRFPFWDWTRLETAQEGIPMIFQQTTMRIVSPEGPLIEINNPLNHYRYASEPGEAVDFEYMGQWGRTYRWVNNIANPTEELYSMARTAFSEGVELHVPGFPRPWSLKPVDWLREKVAGLFDYPLQLSDPSYGPNLWGHFSNTAAGGVYLPDGISRALANIEESHNKVHLDIGGVGSMSVNEYAGFDPIFYFHHCNVDRIYAFWEYVYPEYWMGDGWLDKNGILRQFKVDEDGNFTQDPGSPTNHATQLIPFRNQALAYWNSDNTRGLLTTSPTKKYYTYPAITDPLTGVRVKVDEPYDVNNLLLRTIFQQTLKNHWGTVNVVDIVRQICQSGVLNPQLCKIILHESERLGISYLRHFIFIGEVPEFAFPGSYHLELYLLPNVTRHAAPQVVNSVSVLGRGDPAKCAACKGRQAAGNRIRGIMHLNPIIVLYLISLYRPEDSQDRWPNLPPPRIEGDTIDKHWLATLIHLSVGVRLVTPDKKPLAVADPTITIDGALHEAKTPRVTLHSRRIDLTPPKDRKAPATHIDVEDATDHGTLEVDGGWKAY